MCSGAETSKPDCVNICRDGFYNQNDECHPCGAYAKVWTQESTNWCIKHAKLPISKPVFKY